MVPDFEKILREAAQKRFALQAVTNTYRVVNGSGDGLEGVTLDRYAEHWQLQFFDRTWFWCESEICNAVIQLFHPLMLVVKERLDPSGKSLQNPVMRVVFGKDQSSSTVVREQQSLFHVDLLDTVNPGLFLDMRENRLALAPLSAGGEMLNLFCYTGSFSIHGRKAGATRAVNVDVSSKILEKVRENYQSNGILPAKGEFFRGDSEEYLQYANRKGLRFRLVVLDPPSFSRHERGIFQAKNHLGHLAGLAAQIVEPQGYLFVSTNLSEFTPQTLANLVQESIAPMSRSANLEWVRGQGIDFPGSGGVKESCLSAVLLRLN